jgi:hypothetical protein
MAYKDKAKEKENKRLYYLKNKEKILNRAKEWNKEHPERVGWIKRNYFRHNDICKHTKTIKIDTGDASWFECLICGEQLNEQEL